MRHPFLRTLAGQGRDANFKNTVLLLHGDGTNGAQNNTFVDGSTNNFTITRNGNTTQGSFSPYGDNWSNYFDGTGDYLSVPDNNALDVTTENLTIECWIYVNAFPSSNNGEELMSIVDKGGVQGSLNPNYQLAFINSGGAIKLRGYFIDGATVRLGLTGSTTIQANTWYHVALVRNSSTGYIFLNGTQDATGTLTGNMSGNANPLAIGFVANGVSRFYFNGYISNLRILKGTAQYTANFTPPTTPFTAITNTSLLTCQSNRFVDNSTNAFAITRNGDVSVQRFSPFAPSAAYSTSAIGGSGYFDGTGDELNAPSSSFFEPGGGDFTIEAWVYLRALPSAGNKYQIAGRPNSSGYANFAVQVLSTGAIEAYFSNSNTLTEPAIINAGSVPIGAWTHIAFCKSGTNSYTRTLYVNGSSVGTATATSNPPTGLSTTTNFGNSLNGFISDVRIIKGTAQYTAAFTPPTAPLTAVTNTSLLCNFTNAGIFDNAMMNDLETVGNAQISTTQKKYGTGALYFDGTGDYLKPPNSPQFAFGTGDFTVECWVRLAAAATEYNFAATRGSAGSTNAWTFGVYSSSKVFFYSNAFIATGGTSLNANTWYHVAVTRSGTTLRLFLDGTQDASATNSQDFSTQTLAIGASSDGLQGNMNGYIDDLRITKGVARYTANFTPPAAPLADF